MLARRVITIAALSVPLAGSALLARPAPAPSGAPFTIEQVMSAPFPSELEAAPRGAAVAWVFNDRGARNIWIADAPDYKGKPITSYKGDDGQEMTHVTWTPDARSILYVRGGAPNRSGELPNPMSVPEGVEQAIWIVGVDGGAPRKIAEGSSPAVSPKGDVVAYALKGQIWAARLEGDDKPVQIVKMRGQAGALRWSPDGSQLAVVSGRENHSFVGVYDVATKALRFLDASTDRDSNPVWSPDGRQLAFLRIPAARAILDFKPQRAGEPWSIRVADVTTGKGREVWKAETGVGSVFRNLDSDQQIFWGAGDRLVLPWERDGWTHLYGVPIAGGRADLLTPGAFEVEHVALAADRASIIYSSNQDDIDRRHIWRVPVAGGRPSAITTGKGIEWAPAMTSDGRAIAFLRSDARRPAHPAIQAAGGATHELAAGTIPADFPTTALVEPEAVTVAAADGMQIPAQLFKPTNIAPGERRPAAIFFHGGSRRQMLLGWNYSPYYHNAYALNQFLARSGYVVLAVNYRSGIGYGMEFREALSYGADGASEFNDVLGAGLYLRNRPDVDPKRIGLWGGSYGGYLTALGLSRASDLFAAGVDIHGVHDWNVVIRNFSPGYDPAAAEQAARRAFASSPMAYIETWRSPVLLIHGDDDRNVPFSESVDLAEALRRQNVTFEQLVFPDEVHSFLRHANWLDAYRAAADFFDRRLAGRKSRTD